MACQRSRLGGTVRGRAYARRMELVLIPGFWLDGSSWSEVAPDLQAAGHTVTAVTLPGLTVDADRSGITLRDHIDAVVAIVDSFTAASRGPIVLVGHSGGGTVAHAVADARPDAVARIVYADSGPSPDGASINDSLPVVDGEVPLPDWSVFDDGSLVDMTDDIRAMFRARAIPLPARVASDPLELSDPRRFDVPVTLITCEFPRDQMLQMMAEGHPYFAELARVKQYDIVDLPTGHWPQFTKPKELAAAILAAVR